MPFRFLDLPGELREQVYDHVLNPDAFREHLEDGYTRYHFDVALFRTSKQIYRESKKIFLENFIFIRIETPWDDASNHVQTEGHVPILATGWQAETFQDYSFGVAIEAQQSGALDRDSRKFLLLVDDLHTFCETWFYSDLSHGAELNRNLNMTIRVRNPLATETAEELPVQIQRRLFKPFGMVKRLHSVSIEGPHSEKVAQEMLDDMKQPEDPPEKCLEDATKLKDAGNEVLKKGDPKGAIALYIQSFKRIHIVCMGRNRDVWGDAVFDRFLHGGPFDGAWAQAVRMILRVRLVANMVKCYLDLRDWDEAEFWGNRTIDIINRSSGLRDDEPLTNFPAAKELGKIYYRTGVACKMQGKMVDARRHFRMAYSYMPTDESVKRELASVSPLLG